MGYICNSSLRVKISVFCNILLHLQSQNLMDQSELFSPTPGSWNRPTVLWLTITTCSLTAALSKRVLPSAETQLHARTAPRKICFKAGLTSYAMITHIDLLKVYRLKLWQFKATGSHNVFRLFQSKVSVLVPLHVYAAEQTRVQHISFGTAGEDNVEPWLV